MGRGRNGPFDESIKKPKKAKNKERGGDLEIFHPHYKQEKFSPFLLSEGLLAEMKKMSSQDLMNILLPNKCEQGLSEDTKKLRQRAALGWGKVHKELEKTPFCHRRERLVKVMFCLEHKSCGVDGICVPCIRKDSINHYAFPDIDEYNSPRRCIEICDDDLEHAWILCMLRGLEPSGFPCFKEQVSKGGCKTENTTRV